ncbi:MAG: hypothetical protein V1721_09465 [Pseudomonadota bacterium]
MVYKSANGPDAQSAGFYGIAYEYNGQVIISYRGTDSMFGDGTIGSDFLNAYGLATGDADTEQSRMAIEFYKAVAGGTDPYAASISVTGHSSGGGLAGFVGAIYHKSGVLFDNMAFKWGANTLMQYRGNQTIGDPLVPYTNWYNDPIGAEVSIYQLINGSVGPALDGATLDPEWQAGGDYAPSFGGLSAYYVEGEALSIVPGGHSGQTSPTPQALDMYFTDSTSIWSNCTACRLWSYACSRMTTASGWKRTGTLRRNISGLFFLMIPLPPASAACPALAERIRPPTSCAT